MEREMKRMGNTAALWLWLAVAMMSACTKSTDPFSGEVLQTVSSDATMDSQVNEADDMASNVLMQADLPKGRTAGFSDDRFKCATLQFDSVSNRTSGRVIIDFGTGCQDSKGNTRIGKIIVTWSGGRWFLAGSTHVITFSGYSINGVSFSDSDIRTVRNISTLALPLTWTVEATHSLTWPDATMATRTIHHTRQWIRSTTVTDDKFMIGQTVGSSNAASGTNRYGKVYSVEITTPLEYDRSCAISSKVFKPVKGIRVITFDINKVVTIDYGNGTCDATFSVSTGGQTRTMNAKNDSSAD